MNEPCDRIEEMINAGLRFIFILFVVTPFVTSQYRLPDERFEGEIDPASEISYKKVAVSEQNYTIVTWHYEIIVRNYFQDAAHPYVFFHNHEQSHVYLSHYNTRYGCISETATFLQYDIRDPRFNHLDQVWRSPCYKVQDFVRCAGQIHVAAAYPVRWIASIAYRCPNRRRPIRPLLDISYDITIEPYHNVTCLPTRDALSTIQLNPKFQPYLDEIKNSYDAYSTWNLLGLSEYDIKEQLDYIALVEAFSCYKYLFEMIFRLALPQCSEGKVIYQCSEMCADFRKACNGTAGAVLLEFSLGCANLASIESVYPCIYKPVTCDENITAPKHGYISKPGNNSVDSHVHFYCDSGYELFGNTSAVCGYSGLWEIGETPKCRKKQTPEEPIVVIAVLSAVGGFALLLLALSFYVYGKYRHEVFILVFKYFRCVLCCSRFQKTTDDKLYDALVAYHEDDESFVKTLQGKLEQSGYKLYVEYRDGRLGQPMVRYIAEAITESQRVIIILSKAFLDDRMCEYMLDQAFYQTLEGDAFQVVVIVTQDMKIMKKKIPPFLRSFMRTGSTVYVSDPLFCTKIKHAMPMKRADNTDQNGAELPTQHGAKLPTQHSTELPTQHDAELPTQHDAELPTQHDAELPTQHGTELPTQHDAELPTQHGAELPTQHDTELPTQHGAELPTQHDAELPTQHGAELHTYTDLINIEVDA